MKKEILGIMFDCAQVSTSHALPKIVTNKNWFIKALWIISLLVSSAYCIYNLNKSFLYFFNYESITLIETHRLKSIQFPTVTFCSKNPFNPLKLKNYQNISKKINQIKSYLNEGNLSILQFMTYVQQESLQNVIEYKELLNYVGYELNDILIDCRFGDVVCDRSNFVNLTNPKFGNCFQFNSGKFLNGSKTDLKQSKAPGISTGLKLVLFGGFSSSEIDLFYSKGVQIFVHNSSTLPYAD
ncbi:FMRFamide-activated amiloride-sensitive sodium channel-like, partial [Brachionus plicatilis]